MKLKAVRFGRGFDVLTGNQRAQAAEMVIAPGGSRGDRRIAIAGQINGCW